MRISGASDLRAQKDRSINIILCWTHRRQLGASLRDSPGWGAARRYTVLTVILMYVVRLPVHFIVRQQLLSIVVKDIHQQSTFTLVPGRMRCMYQQPIWDWVWTGLESLQEDSIQ